MMVVFRTDQIPLSRRVGRLPSSSHQPPGKNLSFPTAIWKMRLRSGGKQLLPHRCQMSLPLMTWAARSKWRQDAAHSQTPGFRHHATLLPSHGSRTSGQYTYFQIKVHPFSYWSPIKVPGGKLRNLILDIVLKGCNKQTKLKIMAYICHVSPQRSFSREKKQYYHTFKSVCTCKKSHWRWNSRSRSFNVKSVPLFWSCMKHLAIVSA